jgi:hypothetical protein
MQNTLQTIQNTVKQYKTQLNNTKLSYIVQNTVK